MVDLGIHVYTAGTHAWLCYLVTRRARSWQSQSHFLTPRSCFIWVRFSIITSKLCCCRSRLFQLPDRPDLLRAKTPELSDLPNWDRLDSQQPIMPHWPSTYVSTKSCKRLPTVRDDRVHGCGIKRDDSPLVVSIIGVGVYCVIIFNALTLCTGGIHISCHKSYHTLMVESHWWQPE